MTTRALSFRYLWIDTLCIYLDHTVAVVALSRNRGFAERGAQVPVFWMDSVCIYLDHTERSSKTLQMTGLPKL